MKRKGPAVSRRAFCYLATFQSSRRVPDGPPPQELLLLLGEELQTVYFSPPPDAAGACASDSRGFGGAEDSFECSRGRCS